MDEATIGARLRTLRRWRGKTQTELAGLAGLSPSFISMVETGQRPLDRRSHIAALASALRVSETDLAGGPHLSSDRQQSDPHMSIPALRVAILSNTLTSPVTERARALTDLAGEVAGEVRPACRDANYLRAGELLPSLIDELHVHVAEPADEAALRLALETLVDACVAAEETANVLGYTDLAHAAAARAMEAAAILGDPVPQGKAAWAHVMALPRDGMPERKLAVAERAAHQLEPHARQGLGVQVLGMLTLTAAMAARWSIRGPRPGIGLMRRMRLPAGCRIRPWSTGSCSRRPMSASGGFRLAASAGWPELGCWSLPGRLTSAA